MNHGAQKALLGRHFFFIIHPTPSVVQRVGDLFGWPQPLMRLKIRPTGNTWDPPLLFPLISFENGLLTGPRKYPKNYIFFNGGRKELGRRGRGGSLQIFIHVQMPRKPSDYKQKFRLLPFS